VNDINKSDLMNYFLDFSVEVTGFSLFHLQGTGQVDLYFETIWSMIGGKMFQELLLTFNQDQDVENILASDKLGLIAGNIIKLWYTATWYKLPKWYIKQFASTSTILHNHSSFIPNPYAYTEGLLWPAIGVHPRAAKAPGYATWSQDPKVISSELSFHNPE